MRLARDCHPAVRAVLVDKLAFIQTKSELGWQLFDAAFKDADERVWVHGADTLYYATGKQFARAKPYLDRMESSSVTKVRNAWGRLVALAVLGGQIARDELLEKLIAGANPDAWDGAVMVWVANADNHEFAAECLSCLQEAAGHAVARQALLRQLGRLFRSNKPIVKVPLDLFRAVYMGSGDGGLVVRNLPPLLGDWLCRFVEIEPDEALEIAEIAANFSKTRGSSSFNDHSQLGTLLTSLFREAEERERSDNGAMLARVISLQDVFLSMSPSDLSDWLHASERPGQ